MTCGNIPETVTMMKSGRILTTMDVRSANFYHWPQEIHGFRTVKSQRRKILMQKRHRAVLNACDASMYVAKIKMERM